MKIISYILVIFMMLPILVMGQVEKKITSTPKKVVVYPIGAQIESEVSIPIQKGPMKIILTGLTSKVNAESVRIISDGSFTILNVQYKIDYINQLDKDAESEKLLSKIEELNTKVGDEEIWIKIINEKLEFLKVNKQISGKNESISPVAFTELNQIYGSNFESLSLEKLRRERTIENYKNELEKLNNQLAEVINNVGTPSGVIEVTIDGKQVKTGKMGFTYYVYDASWYPTYDIRFLGFDKPLEITYFANIKQNTDINWENVEIILSTAKMNISAQIPFLNPFYLGYYTPYKPAAAGGRQVKAAVIAAEGVADLSYGYYAPTTIESKAIQVKDSRSTGENTIYTPALETVKEYVVSNPQTIPAKNANTTVTYGEGTLNASYDYQSIPKLGENVYLIAQIKDWNNADLNSGIAKLYLENSYVGKSFINTTQFKDTLDLSFGVDNNLSIKREKVTTFSEKTFAGSNIKETVGYKITIRNNKSYPVTTSVFDQIPISTDSKIVVEVLDFSNGVVEAETGKVTWKLELKPNETKTVIIKYSVKYPKDKQVIVQ
ncbi:MAG: hypothetical protein H6Q25_225 [Bacteroidetes bacterium]|nr:hypothetical protein [Bacteroidota bacterium]